MYSQHLLRVHHDEWRRQAETLRLIKQAKAQQPGPEQPRRRNRPQRALFGALGLRRPVRHA